MGYELWKAILDAGGNFLVRVGANVSLLSEHADYRRLQDGDILCWPKGKIASGERPSESIRATIRNLEPVKNWTTEWSTT
jgi:hypothetical protein